MCQTFLCIHINKEYAEEIQKLEKELAEFKKSIEQKKNKCLQVKERELAFLNVQFPPEWNSLVLQGARTAYNKDPSYYGRKSIRGNIPIGLKLSAEQVQGFEGIDLVKAVHTTFENIRHAAIPVHTIQGFGCLEDERVIAPEHSTFNFEVSHDLPEVASDDFRIADYRVWMEKSNESINFSVDVRWFSKTIQQPSDERFETIQ